MPGLLDKATRIYRQLPSYSLRTANFIEVQKRELRTDRRQRLGALVAPTLLQERFACLAARIAKGLVPELAEAPDPTQILEPNVRIT